MGDSELTVDRLGNVSVDVRDGPLCDDGMRELPSLAVAIRMLLNTWIPDDLVVDSSFDFSLYGDTFMSSFALFASLCSSADSMAPAVKSDLPDLDVSSFLGSSDLVCSESDGDCEADLVGSNGSYTSGDVGPGGVSVVNSKYYWLTS